MRLGQIDFPSELITAARNDNLVVFAGAGVSMGSPANFPSFWRLMEQVATGTGESPSELESPDRFLGRLAHKKLKVHQRAVDWLLRPNPQPTCLHRDLLRLFSKPSEARVVTTNFDLLFESAAQEVWGQVPEVFKAPALPLGRQFAGIVHVHGALPIASSLILTDSDFGRAYLTDGWARRFLVEVFQRFSVLFVGYSHEDTVLQYLARALPSVELGRRFALDKVTSERRRWDLLGIHLVPFSMPSPNDYSCLNDGVHRLANFCRRDVLDWKQEISSAAEQLPPVDLEYADMLRHALADLTLTRFFVGSCKKIEWVTWLDDNEILSPLFKNNELDERSQLLVHWLVEKFAIPHATEMFLLIGKHQLSMSAQLWWHLARHLATDKEQTLQGVILAKWVSVLIHTAPTYPDHFVLQWLSVRCARQGLRSAAFQLFELLINARFLIRGPTTWPGEAEAREPVAYLEIVLGEHWTISELWNKSIKPHLNELAEQVLASLTATLRLRFETRALWDRASVESDTDSYARSAIEPHEQDKHPKALDVIIDAVRDAIEWIASDQPHLLSTWYERLSLERAPLLRRLAIHAVRLDRKLSADRKMEWLLEQNINDRQMRQEVFALLKASYAHTSEANRIALLAAIDTSERRNESDDDRKRQHAIEEYQWLYWLVQTDPNCPLSAKALSDLKAAFPNISVRRHPDLTHWQSDAVWVGPKSPWTTDELLARNATEWRGDLLSFQGHDPFGPDRDGLMDAIQGAAKQKLEWGLDLATALADSAQWASDIWGALFNAWSDWPDDPGVAEVIVQWIKQPEICAHHAYPMARLLHALVKDGGRSYAPSVLHSTNVAAKHLWSSLEKSDPKEVVHDDWLQGAINDPAGTLGEYWINSLSVAVNRGNLTRSEGLRGDYLEAFNAIAEENTSAGYYARTMLISQFPFLLGMDAKWVTDRLLPLFADPSPLPFQHAWHGLLWSRLNRATIDLLTPAILDAVPRVDAELSSRRDRFVEFYVTCIYHCSENPLEVWIPRFFQGASEETRNCFAIYLDMVLRGLNAEQQTELWNKWLSQYWMGRIEGSPTPLTGGEVEHMLGWPIHLAAVFADAVAIATRMPLSQLEHSSIVYELKESALVQQYPASVAELLKFYLKCSGPSWLLHGVDELLDKLGKQSLPEQLRLELKESAAIKGIDASHLDF